MARRTIEVTSEIHAVLAAHGTPTSASEQLAERARKLFDAGLGQSGNFEDALAYVYARGIHDAREIKLARKRKSRARNAQANGGQETEQQVGSGRD